MFAILTKIIPATSTKPTRIKAFTASDCQSITMSLSAQAYVRAWRMDGAEHLAIAQQLCKKMGWTGRLLGGVTPDGYAFVFTDSKLKG